MLIMTSPWSDQCQTMARQKIMWLLLWGHCCGVIYLPCGTVNFKWPYLLITPWLTTCCWLRFFEMQGLCWWYLTILICYLFYFSDPFFSFSLTLTLIPPSSSGPCSDLRWDRDSQSAETRNGKGYFHSLCLSVFNPPKMKGRVLKSDNRIKIDVGMMS